MNDIPDSPIIQGTTGVLNERRIPWARILVTIGVFVAIFAFVLIFYKNSPAGLSDKSAVDIAQVARNISDGKGFTTRFIRPFNISLNKSDSTDLPEMNHAPAYPYAVSMLFKIKSPSDQVVVWTSLAFLILSIISTYLLGNLIFDWRVGLLSAAALATSLPVLQVAISGQEWTLAAFCFTLLLYLIGLHHKSAIKDRLVVGIVLTVLVSVMLAALYMTSRITVLLAIPVLLYFVFTGSRRWLNTIVFVVAFLSLIGWGVYTNSECTGSPVLGINAWDVMADSSAFPGNTLYRSTNPMNMELERTLLFPIEQFSAFSEKLMRRSSDMTEELILLLGLVALPFAVVCVLYKFKNPTANAVRGLLYGMLPLMVVSFAVYSVDEGAIVVFVPVLAVFAAGYFFLLLNAKKLHPVYSKFLIGGFVLATCFGALTNIIWKDSPSAPTQSSAGDKFFASLGGRGFNQVVYTDVPWVAAWRTTGTAVWLPLEDVDVVSLGMKGLSMGGVILTPESENIAPTEIWYVLHKVRLWRDYIANPSEGTKKILLEAGLKSDKSPQALKFFQRLRRNYAVSESLSGFVPQRTNPIEPDDIQILVRKQ